MSSYQKILLVASMGLLGLMGGIIGGRAYSEKIVGGSVENATVVALFESSLQSKISSSATSFTLTSATDKDGNTLASSTYGFIIDEGTSSEEFVLADCTGVTCTNVKRGISVVTGTSTVAALQFSHRRGASVKITNAPRLVYNSRLLDGIGEFPNLVKYKSGTGCSVSSDNEGLCDKSYIDNLTNQGAATSTESLGGISELATQVQMASSTDLGAEVPLVLQAKYSTSSPDVRGRYNIVAMANGYLKQAWLDLTEAFTFTNSVTIPATSANPLTLNSIAYDMPSADGASTTALMTDGSGGLTWNTAVETAQASSTIITASSTWNVPTGVTQVLARIVGGGGGSGDGVQSGDTTGGGGGGAYCEAVIQVTSGGTVSVTVGAGGHKGDGAVDTNGQDGTNTVIVGDDKTVTAGFGSGSDGSSSGHSAGGAGGGCTNADLQVYGEAGLTGNQWVSGYGGKGGDTVLGNGGVISSGSGNQGNGYGSGAGGSKGDGAIVGAAGRDGVVIFEWINTQ